MLRSIYRFLNPRFQSLFLEYKVDLKPRYGHGNPPHTELYDLINSQRDSYARYLNAALELKEYFWSIQDMHNEKDTSNPAWNNGFLPGMDIVGLYTILAELKPVRYVEIGSGNSTKVAYKAKVEQQLDTQIISIDPQPRAEIDRLADQIIRKPFEDTDIDLVSLLEAGDILFIDNSHRVLPNSDAMVFFMEILPRLKKGVIIQIHDIYLPYDYPQFMCDRFYTEQYALAMFLLANPDRFEIMLPNYFIFEDDELSQLIAPVWKHENLEGVERHGGSFWFRIAQ